MERLKFYKVNSLPQKLEKNAIYFVKRENNKFDLYITDKTGTIAYSLNGIDSNTGNNTSQDLTNYFSYVNYIKNIYNKNLGLIIPFYTYPYPDGNWDTKLLELIELAKKNPTIPVIVIVNPNNGAGDGVDVVYRRTIKMLNGAGIFVIGYVPLSYLNVEIEKERQNNPDITLEDLINRIKNDILKWKQFYGHEILGIFFDEVPYIENQEQVDIINGLIDFTKRNNILYTVGNPGTTLLPEYLKQLKFDNIIVYENTELNLSDTFNGDWEDSYREISKLKFSAIIHGQQIFDLFQNLNEYYNDIVKFLNHFHYTYLTDNYQNHRFLKENFELVNRINNNELINLLFNKKTFNVITNHSNIYNYYSYYVSPKNGDDEKNDGKSPDKPFKTIERVFKEFSYNITNTHINIYLDEGEYDLSLINSQVLRTHNTSITFYGKTEVIKENLPFTIEVVPDIDFDNMTMIKINADFSGIDFKRCILRFKNNLDFSYYSFFLFPYKPTSEYVYVETYHDPNYFQSLSLDVIEYKTIIKDVDLYDSIDFVSFDTIYFVSYQTYLKLSGNKINFYNCIFDNNNYYNYYYSIELNCNKVFFDKCRLKISNIEIKKENASIYVYNSIIESIYNLFSSIDNNNSYISITDSRLVVGYSGNNAIASSNSLLTILTQSSKIKSSYFFYNNGITIVDERELRKNNLPSSEFSFSSNNRPEIISYIHKLMVGGFKLMSKNISNNSWIGLTDTLLLINCSNDDRTIQLPDWHDENLIKDKLFILKRTDRNCKNKCFINSYLLNNFEEFVLTPLNDNLILYNDGSKWNILNNYDGITGISQKLAMSMNNYFSPYVKNASKLIEVNLLPNRIYFIPFILSENFKITNLGIKIINLLNILNQNVNISVGIYTSRNNLPEKIVSNSRKTINTSDTGFINIEMNSDIVGLQKGVLYYLSIVSDSEIKVNGISSSDTLINFGYDISTSNWISYYYINSDTTELPDIVDRNNLKVGNDNIPFIVVKGEML